MGFDDPIQFFHNNYTRYALRKRANLFDWQGIDHAEFQNRIPAAADFLDVLIAGRGRDQANRMVGPPSRRSCGEAYCCPGESGGMLPFFARRTV